MEPVSKNFVNRCLELAKKGRAEGGIPISSILVSDGRLIGEGYNQRVQQGSPILHGEMDCLNNAGRLASYRNTILYTSLSPCMMCSGTIVQFKIPKLVICEKENFPGNVEFLRSHGVEVIVLNDERFIELMRTFIDENPDLWAEDIFE